MKSRVTRLLSVGMALAAVTAVYAQNKIVTADVPFSFYMGSSLMPQGAYRVNEISNGDLVRIMSMQGNAAIRQIDTATLRITDFIGDLFLKNYGWYIAERMTVSPSAALR